MARRGVFDFDSLTPSLKALLPKVDAGVDLAFDMMEPTAESHARLHAPWTDNTGNARNGLFARHESDPMVVHRLVIYHTMPYGVFLEVRWSGKYAIIGPTMLAVSPDLAANVAAAVNRAIRS
jgi:hypothetical protein